MEMSRVAAQLEKKGMPVVLESFEDEGINITAKQEFMREGVPMVREVLTPQDTSLKKFPGDCTQKFVDALTTPLTDGEKESGTHVPSTNEGILTTGTYDEISELLEGKLIGHSSIGPIAEMTDGLPVVPPTESRVAKMLKGTSHDPEEIMEFGNGFMGHGLHYATVKKVATNAVMAGCKPEYLPVVIAAVEACLIDEFCMHGLLATTWFSGPMVIVNGPIARSIGMNSGGNALGQGNRANATIGRALQLVIRNVGGGKPGGVDRATLGNPGKYTFCFAEDEDNSCWESLALQRGFSAGQSTVTLFAADGVQGIADQKSRDPESLCRSLAASLLTVGHPKFAMLSDAFVILSPEHQRIFANANWSKQQVLDRLTELTTRHGSELLDGVDGIAEGMPDFVKDMELSKFKPGGLNIVRAGGTAGLFSAIVGGWLASGDFGSSPVSKEIVL